MDLESANKLTIRDKSLFDKYFEKFPPQNSEFTFTNLFMWRNFYDLNYLEQDSHLFLFSHDYLNRILTPVSNRNNPLFFFPPIGPDPFGKMEKISKKMDNIEFHRVPEHILPFDLNDSKINSSIFEILDDRNNWDYVYEIDKLIELPGNKYRQNRRWRDKFLDSYDYEFEELTEDNIDKCKELQLEWCIMRECEDDEGLEQEQKAIYEALDNFKALGFVGAMICIDDKCAAYTFGEILNPETVVVHVEKAHMKYKGGYQAINNLFLKEFWSDLKFVNREQDLGVEGLRRAKESYKPVQMIKKSIVYPK